MLNLSATVCGFRCRVCGIVLKRLIICLAFHVLQLFATIPVIANETARMVQAFRSWPQSHWSRPTYCPGWTAADAVAHLATGGDFYAQGITSGRRGEPTLPWGANSPAESREARQAAMQNLLNAGPA